MIIWMWRGEPVSKREFDSLKAGKTVMIDGRIFKASKS